MSTDDARQERSFWSRKMDEAAAFMERMRTYPVRECGEPLVSIPEALDGLDAAFSDTLLGGRHKRLFFCREGLVSSLVRIAGEISDCGWLLKIEDAYRTPAMQRSLLENPALFDLILERTIWELGGELPDPGFLQKRMGGIVAARCRIGTHISGSALDVSVIDRDTGEEVPRGGKYVEISVRTPMDSPYVTDRERANRRRIREIFARHGWQAYPWEFWHFSCGDSYACFLEGSGAPARYGAVVFDGATSRTVPESASDEPFHSREFFESHIAGAFRRLAEQEMTGQGKNRQARTDTKS